MRGHPIPLCSGLVTVARRIHQFVLVDLAEQPKWTEVGGFWITVVMGIIAVIAIVVAAMATYRASRPKRVLRWGYKVIPITDDRLRQSGLSVVYNEQPLRGALTAEIILKNDCRKDFSTADFEEGRPLQIKVKERILNVLDIAFEGTNAPRPRIEQGHDNDGGLVTIEPSLFPARSSMSIRLLLADDKGATVRQFAVFSGHEIKIGLPEIQLVSPIKDVAVRFSKPTIDGRKRVILGVFFGVISGIGAGVLSNWLTSINS